MSLFIMIHNTYTPRCYCKRWVALAHRKNFYCLWSKLLCKLSSFSDLKSLPHALHTNGWLILARGLALSPLSVVGPMLEADILLIPHVRAVLNLSVSVAF